MDHKVNAWRLFHFLAYLSASLLVVAQSDGSSQQPLRSDSSKEIALDSPIDVPLPLFANLERLSRLVDISYCIGYAGVSKPFECVSRCNDFPTLTLIKSWNTGILLSDSCGYIAVDHGPDRKNGNQIGGPEKAIVVAFRGTYSVTNTVVDLSTIPQKYIPYPSPDDGGEQPEKPEHRCTNCTVHMGFLHSWQNAREVVIPELQELRKFYPDYPIHLVGHSLGGAVASLAALELKVSFGWDVTVTTFGEPRLGNQELADYINLKFDLNGDKDLDKRMYRRVTHAEDPVPLLPLSEWGYRSHAGEIYITKASLPPDGNDLRECVGNEDPNCSSGGYGSLSNYIRSMFGLGKGTEEAEGPETQDVRFPTQLKLWQLFFAHRDYFWRLGLCVPGGDPVDWGRDKFGPYPDEL